MAVAPPPNATKPLAIFSPTTAANKIGFRISRVWRATSFGITRASDPKREAPSPNSDGQNLPFVPQEDLVYLVKLGAGSLAGAAAIKYGSVIFPEVTKPNLIEAIAIITAPVVVAVVLLIKQSRVN
nr:CDKN2A-interacting protein [Ipomoea batatas]